MFLLNFQKDSHIRLLKEKQSQRLLLLRGTIYAKKSNFLLNAGIQNKTLPTDGPNSALTVLSAHLELYVFCLKLLLYPSQDCLTNG